MISIVCIEKQSWASKYVAQSVEYAFKPIVWSDTENVRWVDVYLPESIEFRNYIDSITNRKSFRKRHSKLASSIENSTRQNLDAPQLFGSSVLFVTS